MGGTERRAAVAPLRSDEAGSGRTPRPAVITVGTELAGGLRSHYLGDKPMHERNLPISAENRCVYIVDDDRDVRTSISFMLGAAGLQSRPFVGGVDFVEALGELCPGVILLDLRMPDMDGFRVMTELTQRGVQWPVLAMTGHGEIAVAVRAMKLGALDFIEKPFAEELLLGCLDRAFVVLEEKTRSAEEQQAALDKLAQLTRRECEVLRGLLAGLPNKSLARRLEISLRTVEMHRANMMERLGVSSLAEALTLAVRAGVEPLERDVA